MIAISPVALRTSLDARNTLSNLLNAIIKSSSCNIRKIRKIRQICAESSFKSPVSLSNSCMYHGAIERKSTMPKNVVAYTQGENSAARLLEAEKRRSKYSIYYSRDNNETRYLEKRKKNQNSVTNNTYQL